MGYSSTPLGVHAGIIWVPIWPQFGLNRNHLRSCPVAWCKSVTLGTPNHIASLARIRKNGDCRW